MHCTIVLHQTAKTTTKTRWSTQLDLTLYPTPQIIGEDVTGVKICMQSKFEALHKKIEECGVQIMR